MIWHTVPGIVQRFLPDRLWHKNPKEHCIYLTFDDGPVPGVTDYVLQELARRDQKATFFVVGDNVRKYPTIALELLSEGHGIGNHTFNHLNGWKTDKSVYLENITKCDKVLGDVLGISTKLFRPPYGMITSSQALEVCRTRQLVMWNMLSGDYDQKVSPQYVLKKSIQHTKAGSIVIFHDQIKTKERLPKILPQYLDYIQKMGFKTGIL